MEVLALLSLIAFVSFVLGFASGKKCVLYGPKPLVLAPTECDLLSTAEMIRYREYHMTAMKLHVEEMWIMGQTGAPIPEGLKRYLSVEDIYVMGCARRAMEDKQDAEMFTVLPELSSNFRETAHAARVKRTLEKSDAR